MTNIIQTEEVIFRNTCVYTHTHMHVTTINGKGAMNLRENKEGYMGGWWEKGEERSDAIIL